MLKHTINKDKNAEGLPQFTAKEPAVQQSITRFFPSRSLWKQQLQKTTQQAGIKKNRREEQMRTGEGRTERENSKGEEKMERETVTALTASDRHAASLRLNTRWAKSTNWSDPLTDWMPASLAWRQHSHVTSRCVEGKWKRRGSQRERDRDGKAYVAMVTGTAQQWFQ